MNFWQFCDQHCFVMIVVILALCLLTEGIVDRICRSINIKENGWPPPHLNASGDFKKEEDL